MSRRDQVERLELVALQGARRELGPTPEQGRALRSAVFARVGLVPAASVSDGRDGVDAPRPSGIRSAPAPRLELLSGSTSAPGTGAAARVAGLAGLKFGWRVLTGAALSGVLVGLGAGYWFGTASQGASERGERAPRETAPMTGGRADATRAAVVLPGEDLSAQVEVTELELARPAERPGSAPALVPSEGARASAAAHSPEVPAPMSFYEELTYLRRAQAALRKKESALALGLMQSLDGLNTGGALLSERAMTKILALCLLDRADEATDVARQLVSAEGGALYVHRVSHSCAAGAAAEVAPPAEEAEPEPSHDEIPESGTRE